MSYYEIPNLYRAQTILAFRRVFALEKIHGTSAHVAWKDGALRFFSGGAKHESFVALFDAGALSAAFAALGHPAVTVYGEAYGGKMQGMSGAYGKELRFIAFEARVADSWLAVPQAADVCEKLGLEFVPWREVECTLAALDAERDRPSEVAERRGCGADKPREGIVIHPPFECSLNNGSRLLAKHKGEAFSERASKADTTLDPEKHARLTAAEAVAFEWVTPTRLEHVLDALGLRETVGMEHTRAVIIGMVADVRKESADGEIAWSREVETAIGSTTAKLLKRLLNASVKP